MMFLVRTRKCSLVFFYSQSLFSTRSKYITHLLKLVEIIASSASKLYICCSHNLIEEAPKDWIFFNRIPAFFWIVFAAFISSSSPAESVIIGTFLKDFDILFGTNLSMVQLSLHWRVCTMCSPFYENVSCCRRGRFCYKKLDNVKDLVSLRGLHIIDFYLF